MEEDIQVVVNGKTYNGVRIDDGDTVTVYAGGTSSTTGINGAKLEALGRTMLRSMIKQGLVQPEE